MSSVPAAAPRTCPFCDGPAGAATFPYASRFAGETYAYRACRDCGTRFIDPLPSDSVFARIYAPSEYHDEFYDDEAGQGDYAATAALLARHLPKGARVLDYGCGAGHLLTALRAQGFDASGAEFSGDAAGNAAARSGCTAHDLSDPAWPHGESWDCVHFGDVIEHLADPKATLSAALGWLKPGGWLSATGPLKANPSVVNAAAAAVGGIKRMVKPGAVAEFPPYHLLFTNAAAQRGLFARLGVPLKELVWEIEETGWPYRDNGAIRNMVALSAIAAARVLPDLGNRFRALYRKGG